MELGDGAFLRVSPPDTLRLRFALRLRSKAPPWAIAQSAPRGGNRNHQPITDDHI